MSFNVLFRGLVCHLTKEKVAVFLDVEKHELRLVVRESDIVGKPSFESDQVHAVDPDEKNPPPRKSFKIAGGTLRIEGVTDKQLTRKEDFTDRVPSLRKASSCNKLRPEIKKRRVAAGAIAGYLELPGGEFSVRHYFPEQALFLGDKPQCIARVVQLALKTNGKNITIRNGSKKITVKPDAEVSFVNVDDKPTMAQPNLHFHHYYHAIYSGCGMGSSPIPPAEPKRCDLEQPGQVFPGSDCSNSQEP